MPENINYSHDKYLNTNMVTLNGVQVIDPSALSWGLQDVSKHDAGRDEGSTMHTMKISQKRTYQLEWNMIDPVNASIILKAVNTLENFQARLWDAMNGQYETRTYYVGDRTAPMQQWMPNRLDGKVFTKVSFQIIEV